MTFLINQHPALVFHKELENICSPLKILKINYFGHGHLDNKGNFSALNNNPAFMEHYLKNQYYNADIHMAGEEILKDFIIWDEMETSGESAKLDQEAESFGIKHTFTIIEKNSTRKDFFHFAVNESSQSINQVFLANIDLLKLFIQHYKNCIQQSKKLSTENQTLITLDKNLSSYHFKLDQIFNKETRENFLKLLKMKDQNLPQDLTPRETECLSLYVRGYTAKDIAEKLFISRRTVETYLMNLKDKFFVTSKGELIEKAMSAFYSAK